MMISKEWLFDFVDFGSRRDEDIAREFTLRVAEVEGIIREADAFENMCVGVIREIDAHPKADRLRVCSVDVGERVPLEIVCGGSNLEVGQKVAVARLGARVRWHGVGELVTLEPAEIRGVKSDGMICGADEIGLGAEFLASGEKEILDLSFLKVKAGTPLAIALGKNSVSFELDNKALSNRPDLWGLRGLAREFGAVLGAKVLLPAVRAIKTKTEIVLDVVIKDAELCSRYEAVVVSGVDGSVLSPAWMQKRLNASGIRPINAIVDVTNYVMLEGGQPLHAFDFDLIKENEKKASVVVRQARVGEKFQALDGKNYELPNGALVIATKKEVVAIAGVMGGAEHSINANTKRIVIESANFDARSIRRTSAALGIRTESSSRFEKGLDPCTTEWGLARAVELLMEIFPRACVASRIVDVKKVLPKPRKLELTQEDLDRAIGGGVTLSAAQKILGQLGFGCSRSGKKIRVIVPTFRLKDIVGVHDLIEEVVRMQGYEKIVGTLPAIQLRNILEDQVVANRFKIKTLCVQRHGLTEVNAYAYIRPQTAALFGIAHEQMIELANPLSSERPFLAPTLAMNLVEVVEKNQRTSDEIAIFEIAKVFKSGSFVSDVSKKADRAIPEQMTHLGIAIGGKNGMNNFARVREIVKDICGELGYTISVQVSDEKSPWWKSGSCGIILCDNEIVGYISALEQGVRSGLGIDHDVVIAEIDLTKLFLHTPQSRHFKSAASFQSSVRDIAVSIDESVVADELLSVVRGAHPLVRGAEIFDIFRGAQVGENKKAVAIRVTLQADDHTLTGDEVGAAYDVVVFALQKKCGGTIR